MWIDGIDEELFVTLCDNLDFTAETIFIWLVHDNIKECHNVRLDHSGDTDLKLIIKRAHDINVAIVVFAAHKDKLGLDGEHVSYGLALQPGQTILMPLFIITS